jgi:MFS transporter, DHA1 family, inner membrane transport protein
MKARTSDASGAYRAVSAALFTSLFAGQAALIVMSPVLAEAASDLNVSTAAAGQLRTLTGLAAGITALMLGSAAGRVGLRRQLIGASALLALGSLASAVAPSFALLALAQLPIGVAVAVLTTAGTLAAAEWVPAELRTRTLSWALVGQPAAWIVGMPLIGLVGEHNWRYGWLALPLVAAVAAAALVAPLAATPAVRIRPTRTRVVLGDRVLVRWLASELLANAAWAGTLVFSGALYSESYGTSAGMAGLLLAVAACAYVAGNLTCRRLARHEPRRVLVVLAALLAITTGLFGIVRVDALLTTALFSSAAFVAGGRTLIASGFALETAPDLRPAVTSLRAATMQFGYFVGSMAGGLALAVGGYSALGATMGAFFLSAAAALAQRPTATQRRRAMVRAPHASGHGFGSSAR